MRSLFEINVMHRIISPQARSELTKRRLKPYWLQQRPCVSTKEAVISRFPDSEEQDEHGLFVEGRNASSGLVAPRVGFVDCIWFSSIVDRFGRRHVLWQDPALCAKWASGDVWWIGSIFHGGAQGLHPSLPALALALLWVPAQTRVRGRKWVGLI